MSPVPHKAGTHSRTRNRDDRKSDDQILRHATRETKTAMKAGQPSTSSSPPISAWNR